ncbi:F0F1 ATP synthase subunit B [Marivita sp. S2033]|uniref:F0F1 ATP synthase subunit B family protein n=1 Tax=Marivita sp. S2033 TaxID=3373187 RepID=UPI0039821AF5
MSIDWITVGAQILNFLVLVWLLKRFLYRPILDGIDAREAEIAARMGEAARIREDADAREAEYQAEIAALSASRADVLNAARAKADDERKALLADARARLLAEEQERARHIEKAEQDVRAELHRTGAAALLDLTRKALADLADETLEQRIVAKGAAQLEAIAAELTQSAKDTSDAVAFTRDALPTETQSLLRDAVARILPGVDLRFKTDPEMARGLSLKLGAAQVDWNIDSYLDGLDAKLDALAEGGSEGQVSDAA